MIKADTGPWDDDGVEFTRLQNACGAIFFVALPATLITAVLALIALSLAGFIVTGILAAVALVSLWAFSYVGPKKAEVKVPAMPAGRISVDSDYFMPYCVCPECDVEALHWMREPNLAAATRCQRLFTAAVKDWERKDAAYHRVWSITSGEFVSTNPFPRPKETGDIRTAIAVVAGDVDVIRNCRECGHEWGQRVGLSFRDRLAVQDR